MLGNRFNTATRAANPATHAAPYHLSYRDDSEVSNALVAQKDRVLALCNHDDVEKAKVTLDGYARLWRALDYGYKADECYRRIATEAGAVIDSNLTIKARRGSTLANGIANENARLAAVIADCREKGGF